MATVHDFNNVKKILVELITHYGSPITMIRLHTGIPAKRIYELVNDAKATRREKTEIKALFKAVLNFEDNPAAILNYLTSQEVIDKKKEKENAGLDTHDFYDSGPDFRELDNYANKHGV